MAGDASGTAPDSFEARPSLALTNGLAYVNGLAFTNGLAGTNGLANTNGLALTNGLAYTNGLAATNGLMTSDGGRKTVAYLVRCALTSGDSIWKQDQYGNSYQFFGAMGLAPGWKNGSIDQAGQEYVSACMMAFVNTAGVHYPIWLDSMAPSVGWGLPPGNYRQEGTFFGNILVTGLMGHNNTQGPHGFFCEGDGFKQGVVAGRLGDSTSDAFYNAYPGQTCRTSGRCTGQYSNGSGAGNLPDTYQACDGYNMEMTVWRDPNASFTFDSGYWYSLLPQNGQLGKALDDAGGNTSNGAQFGQYGYGSGNSNQQFQIVDSGAGNGTYVLKLRNNTGKCLDDPNGNAANGTKMQVWDCNYAPAQQFKFTNDPATGSVFMRNMASNKCLDNSGSWADGANPWLWDCDTNNLNQKWQLRAH